MTLPKPILTQVRAILTRDADADRMALDFDLAWRALPTALLDLSCESMDLDVLLDWSRRPDAAALVAALPEPVERHLEDWLRPRLGDQVQVVLALWRTSRSRVAERWRAPCGRPSRASSPGSSAS